MYLFKFVKAMGFLIARENPVLKHTLIHVLYIVFVKLHMFQTFP